MYGKSFFSCCFQDFFSYFRHFYCVMSGCGSFLFSLVGATHIYRLMSFFKFRKLRAINSWNVFSESSSHFCLWNAITCMLICLVVCDISHRVCSFSFLYFCSSHYINILFRFINSFFFQFYIYY